MSETVSSVLVGRAGEVAALAAAVADEQVSAVLIGGEAGIGKSRVVAEFSARLTVSTVCAVGRCSEFGGTAMPFAPFAAAFASIIRSVGVEEVAALLPPRPALAKWLPQVAVRSGVPATDSDRTQLFGEVLLLLEQLALTRPVVVVLEDLHWADSGTRELLSFLVANLERRGVLLVGTYRPAESAPMRDLLAQLRRDPAVRVLAPAPLTRHEVGRQLAALTGSEPEPAVISRVFERSGGNPLFVEALSRSRDGAELTDLLLSFVSGLSADGRAVADAAAVIGSGMRHQTLAALVDLPEPALLAAVRELTDRHVLRTVDGEPSEGPGSSGYEFRHVLIRQAIYHDLLPAQRVGMHAAVAEIIGRQTLPPTRYYAELAQHTEAAGDLHRALLAYWNCARGLDDAAARVHPLRRVVQLWDRLPTAELPDTTRARVLAELVAACNRCGEITLGIDTADRALRELDRSGEPVEAAQLYLHRAALRSRTGAGPGTDLDRGLALLPVDPPSLLRAQALATRALQSAFSGDSAATIEDADEVLRILDALPDGTPSAIAALTARAHAYRGLACRDDIDTAIAHFETARAAVAETTDLRIGMDVAVWESALLHSAGRYAAAIEVIERGLRTAHSVFHFEESGPILFVKWVQSLTALGRWDEALAVVDDVQLGQLPPLTIAAVKLCYSTIAVAQGDSSAAERLSAQAGELLGDGAYARQYRIQLAVVQATIALTHNDIDTARTVFTEALAHPLLAHPRETWPLVASAAGVEQAPPELLALASSLPRTSPVDNANAAAYRAQTSHTSTDWTTAADSWAALDQPYERARALLTAAECLVAESNRESATTLIGTVCTIAADLGAVALTDAAHNLARRARLPVAHAHPGPATAPTPRTFGLTARELDVLRLVAKGMTNRAIATELYISANTAGVHVSRILTKLSATSRTEAAAIAHRNGLIDDH
ncbi:helix-turn-helix transcriptional regulator [Nocardia sp. NPDC058640]|uniref:helix-turn-helix transcriptional regulator n=1 Tax=Nocardia sp. NPDC058640 TaxID=3346571 RepID=UPI0036593A4E